MSTLFCLIYYIIMLNCILNSVVFLQKCFVLTRNKVSWTQITKSVFGEAALFSSFIFSYVVFSLPTQEWFSHQLNLWASYHWLSYFQISFNCSLSSGFGFLEHSHLFRNSIHFLLECLLPYGAVIQSPSG